MQFEITPLRSRPFPEARAYGEELDDRVVLGGEVNWLVEGEAPYLTAIEDSLPGVAKRLGEELPLLDFGNAAGILELPILGRLEIVSHKWSKKEFQQMLSELTEIAARLPFSAGTAAALPYDRSVATREDVPYHAFVYLRYILTTQERDDQLLPALNTVLFDPHRRLHQLQRHVPLYAVRKFTPSSLPSLIGRGTSFVRASSAALQEIPLARALTGSAARTSGRKLCKIYPRYSRESICESVSANGSGSDPKDQGIVKGAEERGICPADGPRLREDGEKTKASSETLDLAGSRPNGSSASRTYCAAAGSRIQRDRSAFFQVAVCN